MCYQISHLQLMNKKSAFTLPPKKCVTQKEKMTDTSSNNTEIQLKTQLIQTQQDYIAALKLNLQLVDEKFVTAVQTAETWKQRYENLEKQALDLQSKYLALIQPQPIVE